MRITVEMEIESIDYGGKEFKKEIKKLIEDIDSGSSLTKFKMYKKFGFPDVKKDIDWSIDN